MRFSVGKYKIASSVILTFLFFTFNSIATVKCADSSTSYPYNKHQDPIQQKAQSGERVYFYALPNEACKTNIYIINNDNVLKYRDSNGFLLLITRVKKTQLLMDGSKVSISSKMK